MKEIKLSRFYPPEQKPFSTEKVIDGVVVGLLSTQLGYLEYLLAPAELLWDEINNRYFGKKGDMIIIDNRGVTVETKGQSVFYPFSEIDNLKIHYSRFTPRHETDSEYRTMLSRVEFIYETKDLKFFYKARKKNVLNLCKNLYSLGVRFKEYHLGRRTFLGKQPKYSELQKLKEQYDIEW